MDIQRQAQTTKLRSTMAVRTRLKNVRVESSCEECWNALTEPGAALPCF